MKRYFSKILFLFFNILVPFILTPQNEQRLNNAQKILDKLYDAAGQYNFEKPILGLSEENRRVAAYVPAKNLITVDVKALEICESLGSEANNALAFLIGHELIHAFQKEVRNSEHTTNFLAYSHDYHTSISTEKSADIQGALTSYLAGFGAQKAIPRLIDKIYDAYDLKNKNLSNYPSLNERMQTAKEISETVEGLIDMFEVNKYLLLLGEYKLASYCLEHISEYHQGHAIKNNIGTTYLLSATEEFFDVEKDIYVFPLALSGSTQLENIDLTRGPLSSTQKIHRNIIIDESIEYFEGALKINPHHTRTKINMACAINMKGEHKKAYEFLFNSFSTVEEKSEPYKLALGITEALLGHKLKAATIFNELRKSDNHSIAQFADHNYNILHNKKLENIFLKNPRLPDPLKSELSRHRLGTTKGWGEVRFGPEKSLYLKKNKSPRKGCFYIW